MNHQFHQTMFLAFLFFGIILTTTSAQEHSAKISAQGYAAMTAGRHFVPYEFERRAVGESDVLIEILYAGICHTDLHQVMEDWRKGIFPMVPGHEIVGRVAQTGKNVQSVKVGDYAGVGCMVHSCGECEQCRKHEEQYCPQTVWTYNSLDTNGTPSQGGYSDKIVVDENFVVKIPENVPLERIAPLFCAGITTYSPLRYNNVKAGDNVAVAGFGGLGDMAVQYAIAMGAKVTVFDVNESKRQSAMDLGAVKFVNVRNENELIGLNSSFDLMISTIPTRYDVGMYLRMLKVDGTVVLLGMPPGDQTPMIPAMSLMGRRKVYASLIGGMKETREMLEFSVRNKIYPHVEIIPIQKLDEAFQNLAEGKALFRYVIDMKSLDDKNRDL
ncbi:MAG: NAD(P)-dependent alcohol dehydrogenase [Planctomycetaceae bacterium]|jgi:uncharacterized zinc-type alcohol dehydrogenase-like protein|nr:NAD(P)-dependent alcohol dehydrogenase [Planctomycetaceae bacterium]